MSLVKMFVRHICVIEIQISSFMPIGQTQYMMITHIMQTLLTHHCINSNMSWEEFTVSDLNHLIFK